MDINGNPIGPDNSAPLVSNSAGLGFTFGNKWIINSGVLFEAFATAARYLIDNVSYAQQAYQDYLYSYPWENSNLEFNIP